MTVRLSSPALAWSAYLVVSLILLMFIAGPVYPVAVGALAVGVALITVRQPVRWSPAPRDIAILGALYAACVAAFYIAFQVVTTGSEILLFVVFGAGLLVGVIGPLAHVVMVQRRPLADLGLRRDRLPQTLALGLLLAAVQVAVVLPLVRFGTPDTWLPLAALALMVGLYEAVFFRAYVLAILEPMIGVAPAVAVASGLYALYHVGYGMAAEEMVFLAGLGLVYTVAYAAVPKRTRAVAHPHTVRQLFRKRARRRHRAADDRDSRLRRHRGSHARCHLARASVEQATGEPRPAVRAGRFAFGRTFGRIGRAPHRHPVSSRSHRRGLLKPIRFAGRLSSRYLPPEPDRDQHGQRKE